MRTRRSSRLSQQERKHIKRKTGGRCHVCAKALRGSNWVADHILPYSVARGAPMRRKKGMTPLERQKETERRTRNLLPACRKCNGWRWNHSHDEIRAILRLGVYAHKERKKPRPNTGPNSLAALLDDLLIRRRAANRKRRQAS